MIRACACSQFYSGADIKAGKCEYGLAEAVSVGRFEDEGWRVRKDGSRFWAHVVVAPVRDRDATLVGFSKVTQDLTERRRVELERAARLAAEQVGKGSTFTVRLPVSARREEAAPNDEPHERAATTQRILVVDDNEDALMLLAEALRSLKALVQTITSR